MGRLLKSSQFRLSLIYLGVFGSSVLLLLCFLYWATVGYMARQTEATIEAEIQGLAEQYRHRGLAGLSRLLSERTRFNQSSVYLLTDANKRPLVGNLGHWPDKAADENDWVTFKLPVSSETGPEVHMARARQFQLRGGNHLLVGRDVQELFAVEKLLIRALSWGLGITCLLGLVGAITMSRSVLRRIESINQTSRKIMGGDLSRRIPTSSRNDDFDALAHNLNAMLDRIQRLMEDVRRVSDNVAHDLRTPLTRLRNQLEELSESADMSEDERVTTRTAILEADALLSTFNSLLRIARVEAGHRRSQFCRLDLALIAEDVAEFYEPLAEEKGLRLSMALGSGLEISGDRDLLFQALANLVDNAIKYTPAPGDLSLRAFASGDASVTVEIEDTGPGVEPIHYDKILQRFARLDDSRSTPGNGLGLSLVAAVAQLHGAALVLGEGSKGLRVQIIFSTKSGLSPLPETESSAGDVVAPTSSLANQST